MIKTIKGGIAEDHRGQLKYINEFDMSPVKRFYIISNANTEVVRGWRGHRVEKRWFYALKGSFVFDFVKIDDWENPTADLTVQSKTIKDVDHSILYVPNGFAFAFKALEPDSQVMVYADHGLEHAAIDDYTFPVDYFINSKV